MMSAEYYREQAQRARQLARSRSNRPDVARQLNDMAQDCEELAADIETGAIGVRGLAPSRRPIKIGLMAEHPNEPDIRNGCGSRI